jgi:hypothetical protein
MYEMTLEESAQTLGRRAGEAFGEEGLAHGNPLPYDDSQVDDTATEQAERLTEEYDLSHGAARRFLRTYVHAFLTVYDDTVNA